MGKWHFCLQFKNYQEILLIALQELIFPISSWYFQALTRRQLTKKDYTVFFMHLYYLLMFIFVPFITDGFIKRT